MSLDKAQRYMMERKAQLIGYNMARKGLPGHLTRRPDGVVVPHTPTLSSMTMAGDMMPNARGRLMVELRKVAPDGSKGEWVTHEDDDNLVVTQAERLMANMAAGIANSAINYIELGDPAFPANSPNLSDITLQQTTGERKTATVTVSGNVLTAEVTWTTAEANGFSFTEAGLFIGILGAGSMFARKTFNTIVKTAAFEMRFTWLITFLVNASGSGDCAGVALVGPSVTANETIYTAVGAEASVAATFDFTVGAALVDVFLNGQRLVRGTQYIEIAAGGLTAPVGGPAGNKGIDFIGFTLLAGDVVYLVQRTLS